MSYVYNQHIKGVTFQNQRVGAPDHAALFQMLISDGVISGCGASKSLNVLTISSGLFILAGRLLRIEASEPITINTEDPTLVNKTLRLTAVIDLNQVATRSEFQQFYFRLDDPSTALRTENINTGTGKYYEVEWGTIITDSEGSIDSYNITIGESSGGGGGGGSNFISEEDITFDGASISGSSTVLYSSSGTDWEVIILEASGQNIEFAKRPGSVDICLVSAGNDGSDGHSRKGGNGGEVLNSNMFTLEQGSYSVTVGISGSGNTHDTSIYNFGGSEPLLKAYQANGENNGGNDTTANGGNGVYAFDDDEVINQTYKTRKYGAGGGRGSVCSKNSSTGIWSTSVASGSGGTTGGGAGYPAGDGASAGNGLANTGSGGGGGRQGTTAGGVSYGAGGSGGSGIIIIRNHRTAS